MYYLGGGREEDFINQYSILISSHPPALFLKNFVSSREHGSDFVITPLLEFESFDTGTICNDCSSLLLSLGGGGGGFEPQVGPGTAFGNSEDLNFKIPKRGQKTIVAIHFLLCNW